MGKEDMEESQITRALLVTEHCNGELDDKIVDMKVRPSDSSITSMLLLSIFFAISGSLTYGLAVGYSSPVESEIMAELDLSTAEYSIFGSILTIGGALGAVVGGKICDHLGRRATFGLCDVLFMIGWVAIAVSQDAWSLYLGRLMLGLAMGIDAFVAPIYIAEITPKTLRGAFVVLHMFMICAGLAAAFLLGIVVPWRILAVLGIGPCLLQLLGSFFIVPSPRWLAKIGQDKEFEAALQRLRGESVDISEEATDIREFTESLQQTSEVTILQLFQRKYGRGLIVGIGLSALSQLTGLNAIIFYASSIFESAGFSGTVGTVVLGLSQIPILVVALFMMDKFGRRPLLMASAGGLWLGCMLVSFSFLFQDHDWLTGISPYFALVGILVFVAMYPIGMGGVASLLVAEIYPMNIKGLAGSIANVSSWLSSWVVACAFNFAVEWSSAGTFFILASVSVFALLFIGVMVPETKGQSLEEIQRLINHT